MGNGTKPPAIGTADANPKRTKSKTARGFGIGTMKKLGVDMDDPKAIASWCQKSDPLFRVKGIERTIRMKEFK